MNKFSLKIQTLLPLTLALAILLGAFVFNDYRNQMKGFSRDVERRLVGVQELFEKQLASEIELLSSIIEMLSMNQELQKAWIEKDRESLLAMSSPLLKELGAKHRITHFYFHNLDRSSFLRVYDPERHGDIINRYTLLEAIKTGQESSGIELGKLGTMTLRVVHPWKINNKVVGYIEMGEEIDRLTEKLHDILGVEWYISIYKEFLEREKWEEGTHLLGHSNNWDLLPSAVIVSQTLRIVPKEFSGFLERGKHEYMEMASNLELKIESQTYRVGVVPLYDAEDVEIGDIIILSDVTSQLFSFKQRVLLTGSICVAVGLLLFIIFSAYLGKLESKISGYQNNLEEMVEERTVELKVALDEIKTLRGIMPICSHCKKIRDDAGLWNQLETYVSKHSYAEFSHGICPDCAKIHYSDLLSDGEKIPE